MLRARCELVNVCGGALEYRDGSGERDLVEDVPVVDAAEQRRLLRSIAAIGDRTPLCCGDGCKQRSQAQGPSLIQFTENRAQSQS